MAGRSLATVAEIPSLTVRGRKLSSQSLWESQELVEKKQRIILASNLWKSVKVALTSCVLWDRGYSREVSYKDEGKYEKLAQQDSPKGVSASGRQSPLRWAHFLELEPPSVVFVLLPASSRPIIPHNEQSSSSSIPT